MKRIYHSLSVFLLIAGTSANYAVAQKDTTKLNQSVEVVKAYRPTITNANKVNLMPVVDDTTRFIPEFKYSIDSQPVKSGFEALPIGAANVNKLPSDNLGLGYLKLGAGTYSTPYGELFLNLPKSKIGTFGFHFRHLSSDDKIRLRSGDLVNAPYSQNNGAIFGSVNIGSTILSVDLTYKRDAMNYYGYPDLIPTNIASLPITTFGLEQAYQSGDIKVTLKNNDLSQSALKFDGGFRLGFFDAKTGQKENSGGFFGKLDYNFGQVTGTLDFALDHLSTDSILFQNPISIGTLTEDWLRVKPSVRFDGDKWTLRGGINFVAVSDKSGENSTKIYPDIEFDFRPIEEVITLYAGFGGDLVNNSYGDIAMKNYWAEPFHNVRKSDYTYVVTGGLKGKISREISYNLGLKYSQIKDLYFFLLSSYDDPTSKSVPASLVYRNAFDVIYADAGIFNLSIWFSYLLGKDLSIVLKGNYYNYNLESLPFAPHKPNFDLTASAGLKIIERLTGFVDLEVLGQRKAVVFHVDALSSAMPQTVAFQIDPSIKLNLGATYKLTNSFSLFGRVDNLLNRQNEQWLGYAGQGLRLMAGVTWSF